MTDCLERILSSPYKIKEIKKETANVKIFALLPESGQAVAFNPGMFFMIEYRDEGGSKIKRAYSVASPPGSSTLEFYIGMVGGKLTSKLDCAKAGDLYYLSGPYGKFQFTPNKNKKSLFIAAGTGISPFMSMLNYIEKNGIDENVALLYSVKNSEGIIRYGEFERLKSKIGLKYAITLTKQEQNVPWNGHTGRISKEFIADQVPDVKDRTCYLCGSNDFTKAMTDYLLSLGVAQENIKKDV